MKCPVDETVLAISERRGVEVDYCPQCRGVWLDRGELDKLLDRAAEEFPEPPRADESRERESRERESREHRPPDPKYRKKKKSFLSEFLEFD